MLFISSTFLYDSTFSIKLIHPIPSSTIISSKLNHSSIKLSILNPKVLRKVKFCATLSLRGNELVPSYTKEEWSCLSQLRACLPITRMALSEHRLGFPHPVHLGSTAGGISAGYRLRYESAISAFS